MEIKEIDKDLARYRFYQLNPTHKTFYTLRNRRLIKIEEKLKLLEEKRNDKLRKIEQKIEEDRLNEQTKVDENLRIRKEKIKLFSLYRRRNYTLEKMGQKLGITRERVRQLEKVFGFPNRHVEPIMKVIPIVKRKCRNCGNRFDVKENVTKRFCNINCQKTYTANKNRLIPIEKRRLWQRKRMRAYYRTKKGKKVIKEIAKRQNEKNREKVRARTTLNWAVNSGKIKRPKKCEHCGQSEMRITGHHTDYSKPLLVMWLCDVCHKAEHKRIKLCKTQ